MMNASYGIKGYYDYIPEPFSKFLQKPAASEFSAQGGSAVKAATGDMIFLFMMFMLLS